MAIAANKNLLQYALGAYLGFACGDALGATVEQMTAEQIAESYGTHKEITGGGWRRLRAGEVTDATGMTTTLGQSIIEAKGWQLDHVADHFVEWLYSNPPDISETCLTGIKRYQHRGEISAPLRDNETGNGACMRNLPVVLATLHRVDYFKRWTLEQNHLTHNNPLSDAATLALGDMLRPLILNQDITACEQQVDQLTHKYKEFVYTPYPGNTSGCIIDTMQTVLHHFFNTDNFESCVISTVNQGGDTDTVGAMAGMLAGAHYGVEAIPSRWLKALDSEIVSQIKSQTSELLKLAQVFQTTNTATYSLNPG